MQEWYIDKVKSKRHRCSSDFTGHVVTAKNLMFCNLCGKEIPERVEKRWMSR